MDGRTDRQTDRQMDGRTDIRTDKATYRDARTRNFLVFIYGVTSSTLGGQKSISFKDYSSWYFYLANSLAKANQPFFLLKNRFKCLIKISKQGGKGHFRVKIL